MVTVTGTFLRPDDTPCTGAVTFAVYVAASDTTPDDRVVTPAPVVVRLDDTGSFTVDLVASDDDGWQTDGPMPYTIGINVTGQRAYNYAAYINDPGPYDIGELVVLDWPPNVANIPTDGPQGPQGEAALIVGSFTRDPAELPPDGFLPADWDSPGKPANDLQCLLGYAIIHYPSGHLWSFVGPEKYAPGWVDSGKVTGPQGDQGDAATVDAGTTTTGDAGTEAAVVNSGSTSVAMFDFTIPKGDKGDKGDQGDAGAVVSVTRPNVDDVLVTVDGQTVHYDSGWRSVTADIAIGQPIYLRRVNSTVFLHVGGTSVTVPDSGTLTTITTGFKPVSITTINIRWMLQVVGSATWYQLMWLSSTSGLTTRNQIGNAYASPVILYPISLSWPTNDAIPTSLPGTLVSPAPQQEAGTP